MAVEGALHRASSITTALGKVHRCRSGADGKVTQLEQLYPRPTAAEPHCSWTTGSTVQQLDVVTVVKASQGERLQKVLLNLIMNGVEG
jgi:hypothetical protein